MQAEFSFVENVAHFLEFNLGFSHWWATTVDSLCIILGILSLAALVDLFLRKVVMPLVKAFVDKTENKYDDLLVDRDVVKFFCHMIPVYIVYRLMPLAFIADSYWIHWLQKVIIMLLLVLGIFLFNAVINVLDDIIEGQESLNGRPYKLVFQVVKVIGVLIGVICIISVVVDKSPTVLLTGLGASAAIVSLVFKDTIVGFVSGLQLSANGMVQKGDWITLTSMNVDGFVQDISLHTVKVLNFDKSVVTIPPSTLLNTTFQNWRKMRDEGNRRICRAVQLDALSLRSLSTAELQLVRGLPHMEAVVDAAVKNGNRMPDGGVMSNIALFREYMVQYILHHPYFAEEEYHMVRLMPPTEVGLPLQIFFFVREARWVEFEAIQSAVFEHVYASLPAFSLRAYQRH